MRTCAVILIDYSPAVSQRALQKAKGAVPIRIPKRPALWIVFPHESRKWTVPIWIATKTELFLRILQAYSSIQDNISLSSKI